MTVAAIKIDAKSITREALTIPVDYASAAVIPAGTVLDSQHAVDSLLATLGAASFKYLQDVLDALPSLLIHNVTINLASGAHRPRAADSGADGAWALQQRIQMRPYSETNARITIQGAASSLWTAIVAAQTVTAQQTGSNDPYVDFAGTPFVAGAHKGHFAVLSTGQVAVIHDNTTSRLYLIAGISPALSIGVSTVTVARPSTILRNSLDDATSFNGSGVNPCFHNYSAAQVYLNDVQIDQFGAYAAVLNNDTIGGSLSTLTRVLVDAAHVRDALGFTYAGTARPFQNNGGGLTVEACSVRTTEQAAVPATNGSQGLFAASITRQGPSTTARRSYLRGGGASATAVAVVASYGSGLTLTQAVCDGAAGVLLDYTALLQVFGPSASGKHTTIRGMTLAPGLHLTGASKARPLNGKIVFEGIVGQPCAKVRDTAELDLQQYDWSTQALENGALTNTDVGIEVADAAVVRLPSTTTVSGSFGQARVNGAIMSYAQNRGRARCGRLIRGSHRRGRGGVRRGRDRYGRRCP